MYIFKLIGLTVFNLFRQAWLVFASIPAEFTRWRQHGALARIEEERLDRIRHPAKYLGH